MSSALGISLEIWKAPAHHGHRLSLSPACRSCQQQEPRTFDRCRKRRAYLTRPEAPVPQRLAEKCPRLVRLARLGQGPTRTGPTLFAFGYDPNQDASQTDEGIFAFLRDLDTLLQSGATGKPEPDASRAEIVTFLQAANDAAPDHAAGRDVQLAAAMEIWAALLRNSLGAKAALLWSRDEPTEILSLAEGAMLTGQAEADWIALAGSLAASWDETSHEPYREILHEQHPVARHFGEALECLGQPIPGCRDERAMIVILRTAGAVDAGQAPRLQDLAKLCRSHVAALRVAHGALDILSDTLLALSTQREQADPSRQGRVRRLRCLALLLARELKLLPEENAALHWACLLRGIGGAASDPAEGLEEAEAASPTDPIARALHLQDLPFGNACARILERSSPSQGPTRRGSSSENPMDLAGDCLVVAETFDDLLSRGGSSRPRSVRAAVAFLEASSGIAFDATVVQALLSLEPALTRHAWIFLLGRHPS